MTVKAPPAYRRACNQCGGYHFSDRAMVGTRHRACGISPGGRYGKPIDLKRRNDERRPSYPFDRPQ
ncbi:MAG: hypothetical protein KGO96_13670 [Elusimicrobia bacterium]|nr:hypothetical protein [Elusimicrobiota bacterium]MDE2426943.1 hypothetical protein [Elusimicrobiota bacterium]